MQKKIINRNNKGEIIKDLSSIVLPQKISAEISELFKQRKKLRDRVK